MSIPYLKLADNGVYYVHWTEPNGRNKRISTRTKAVRVAQDFFGAWLLLDQKDQGEKAQQATVSELWAVYDRKHVQKDVGSKDTAKYAWQNLEPHFGALLPSAISQDVVDEYVRKRGRGAIGRKSKPQTCRRELNTLVACLNFSKVTFAFKKPADGAARDRWLKADEIEKLMQAAAKLRTPPKEGEAQKLTRVERFLWLALETAGRREALMDLTWDRVDFETRVIHLAVPGRAETKKRRASVPISKTLMPILKRALAERDVTDPKVVGGVVMTKQVKFVAGKAKLVGVTPHVLRHTAATHMARRGVPLWIIAKVLGNTLAMVERVYAKHAPDDLRAAVNSISGPVMEAAE